MPRITRTTLRLAFVAPDLDALLRGVHADHRQIARTGTRGRCAASSR
jgi:hypothetical protein